MNKKLKHCPFCGYSVETEIPDEYTQIHCPECGAGNVLSKYAREQWNKRTKKETNLKLCPICGAIPLIHQAYDNTWCVQCPKCTLTSSYFQSKNEAIEAWNRRANK